MRSFSIDVRADAFARGAICAPRRAILFFVGSFDGVGARRDGIERSLISAGIRELAG